MVWEQQQLLPRHEPPWALSPSPAQDTGSPENGGAGNKRLLTKISFPSGQVLFKLYLKTKLSKSASLSNYFLSLQQLKLRFKELRTSMLSFLGTSLAGLVGSQSLCEHLQCFCRDKNTPPPKQPSCAQLIRCCFWTRCPCPTPWVTTEKHLTSSSASPSTSRQLGTAPCSLCLDGNSVSSDIFCCSEATQISQPPK